MVREYLWFGVSHPVALCCYERSGFDRLKPSGSYKVGLKSNETERMARELVKL